MQLLCSFFDIISLMFSYKKTPKNNLSFKMSALNILQRLCPLFLLMIISIGCQNEISPRAQFYSTIEPASEDPALASFSDSLRENTQIPTDLEFSVFTGPDLTPSPSVIAAATTGEVFVGVDQQGSLGKEPGLGSVIRLVDVNQDGVFDHQTEFARVDHPRGILPVGNRVFVLHTIYSEETEEATGQNLVVFEDNDYDGIADGPSAVLIENIGNPAYLTQRGTDHSTNGISMGIDGWIYIAVGDFGFERAVGADGTELNMLGGGMVRIRPDGSEMEEYTHGLRNVYGVAIDPYMNIFTRDNTNDGGFWNTRFSHQIQTGEYGYPYLFRNFTEEIIPALEDLGGGSATGALFLDDDRWPDHYNNTPLTADWGRNFLYLDHVTEDRGSFYHQQEEFIQLQQITDVDIDASGVLYLSAWDNAGFRGNPDRGYIVRVVPEGMDPAPFPDLEVATVRQLGQYLESGSAKVRQFAQQELLKRPTNEAAGAALQVAENTRHPLDVRVAGIFTYAQIAGADGIDNLVELTQDESVKEFALRALADRKAYVDQVPVEPFLEGLNHSSDRVKIASIVGLGRLGQDEAIPALLTVSVPSTFRAPAPGNDGPHATPNSEIIPAHVAVKALVEIGATEELIRAVERDQNRLALWALRYVHEPMVVERLIGIYRDSENPSLQNQIIDLLARTYHTEKYYDASWWWGTRPDTHGPYYVATDWEATPMIRDFIIEVFEQTPHAERDQFAILNSKYRLAIEELGESDLESIALANVEELPLINMAEIQSNRGEVGQSTPEEVLAAIENIEGDKELGEAIFLQQSCHTCHAVEMGEPMMGPFLGTVGGVLDRRTIAEGILTPNSRIAQGFPTYRVTTEAGNSHVGFSVYESANNLVLRDMTGSGTIIPTSEIEDREIQDFSLMPPGLANALSYEEFAALVDYLQNLDH